MNAHLLLLLKQQCEEFSNSLATIKELETQINILEEELESINLFSAFS